jgi:hypothetical protein
VAGHSRSLSMLLGRELIELADSLDLSIESGVDGRRGQPGSVTRALRDRGQPQRQQVFSLAPPRACSAAQVSRSVCGGSA